GSRHRPSEWVGSKPTEGLQASLGRHGEASKETNEDHSFGVQRRSVFKKDLTEPTLLEITGDSNGPEVLGWSLLKAFGIGESHRAEPASYKRPHWSMFHRDDRSPSDCKIGLDVNG